MRIGLTSIFVDDQDQAEQFYTQILGFQVKTSAPYGPEERWLSVVAPEEPDGWSWCCTWPTSQRASQAASRQTGRPVLSGATDRVDEILDEAKKAGGTILKPAAKLQWGGTADPSPIRMATSGHRLQRRRTGPALRRVARTD
jgi:catechol 2,3-dioxygenase-like lactoylglutathione lyase family enzyme